MPHGPLRPVRVRGPRLRLPPVTAGPDDYVNPILAGFHPGPTLVRAGDAYYLATSNFAYFPGVPIFRSVDFVHWTQIGHVLDRPSQLPLDSVGISRDIFAPALAYHGGTFHLITTLVDRGSKFVITATNHAGPWSEPTFFLEGHGSTYSRARSPLFGQRMLAA